MPSELIPKLIITSLSSCAAIFSSVLILFNAKDLWTKYRTNASRLTALLHQYYSQSGVFVDMDAEEAFQQLVRLTESQLEEENRGWGILLDHDAPPAQKL